LIHLSWDSNDTTLVVNLVCRFARLVIGAPTSPKLSNAICFDMDEQLLAIARRYDAIYTRYADDLFFSATKPNLLPQVEAAVVAAVGTLRHPKHIRLNFSKTRHSSMRRRRIVTGIILTNDGKLSLGRRRKRQLRSLVYKYPMLSERERLELRGWLAYCRSIEPEFLNSLGIKFGAARLREVTSS
jgi:RNA-directed DNA polymerase